MDKECLSQSPQKSSEYFSDSADLYPTGLFVLNQNGLVFNVNETGLSLISLKKENIISKNFVDFLDENSKSDFPNFFLNTARNNPCSWF